MHFKAYKEFKFEAMFQLLYKKTSLKIMHIYEEQEHKPIQFKKCLLNEILCKLCKHKISQKGWNDVLYLLQVSLTMHCKKIS